MSAATGYHADLRVDIDVFEIPGRAGEWCCYMAHDVWYGIGYGGGPCEAITRCERSDFRRRDYSPETP